MDIFINRKTLSSLGFRTGQTPVNLHTSSEELLRILAEQKDFATPSEVGYPAGSPRRTPSEIARYHAAVEANANHPACRGEEALDQA